MDHYERRSTPHPASVAETIQGTKLSRDDQNGRAENGSAREAERVTGCNGTALGAYDSRFDYSGARTQGAISNSRPVNGSLERAEGGRAQVTDSSMDDTNGRL